MLFILRIINEHDSLSNLPQSAKVPSWIECNFGRSIIIISLFSKLSKIVDNDNSNARSPKIIECRLGKSTYLYLKLYQYLEPQMNKNKNCMNRSKYS